MENEKIEIHLRKWYFVLLFLAGIIMVIAGIFIIISPFFMNKILTQEQYQLLLSDPFSRFMYNPVTQIIIGTMCIIFFGFAAIIFFRKIFDEKPGLIIDNTGIINNSTGISSTKYIRWENIIEIKSFNFIIVRSIIIVVDNPKEHMKCYKNIIIQKMAELDHKIIGSPINIPTDVLKCKYKELVNTLRNELKERKKRKI